jgi:hypothetical protein
MEKARIEEEQAVQQGKHQEKSNRTEVMWEVW